MRLMRDLTGMPFLRFASTPGFARSFGGTARFVDLPSLLVAIAGVGALLLGTINRLAVMRRVPPSSVLRAHRGNSATVLRK